MKARINATKYKTLIDEIKIELIINKDAFDIAISQISIALEAIDPNEEKTKLASDLLRTLLTVRETLND